VQFGILHLVCDDLLSACGKCPTPSSRISLMGLCSFLLLVVGVVGPGGARGDDWGDDSGEDLGEHSADDGLPRLFETVLILPTKMRQDAT
jgi:hypothetical protein